MSVAESPWYLGGAIPASGRLKFLLAALVVVFASLTWGLHYETSFSTITEHDANDYAQLGRQLYRGEGFSSLQTFPYILGWLAAHGKSTDPPWPNLNRFPLPTLLNSLAFHIVGINDFGAVLFGGFFLVATALLVFLLGNRLYGPLAGLVASVLSFTSNTQLNFSISGLSESGAAFFIVAIALGYIFAAEESRRQTTWAFLLGLIIGVGFLQRYNLVLLAAVTGILLLIGPERRSLRSVMAMTGGIIVGAGPWLVYHLSQFGSPLVALTATRNLMTGIVPDDIYLSLKQHNVWHLVWTHFDVVLNKLGSGWLIKHWHRLFSHQFIWLGPAFLACIFVARSRRALSLWLFSFGAFIVTFLAYSMSVTVVRFYHPFVPLLLVVVVGSAVALLRCLPQRFHFVLLLASLAVIITTSMPFLRRIGQHPTNQPDRQLIFKPIRSTIDPGTVVASNRSWLISWYCDRPAVRFQAGIPQLVTIDRDYTPVGAIYLEGTKAQAFERRLQRSPLGEQFLLVRKFHKRAVLWVRKRASSPPT